MPKIPMYQQKIGMASGPISPRAQTGAFTQVGKAYAQLGQSVQQAAQVAGEFELARQDLEAQNVLDTKGRDALDSITKLNMNNEIRTLSGYEEAFDQERNRILSDVDAMEGLQGRQKRAIKEKLLKNMNVTRANEGKRAFALELQDKTVAFDGATDARLERMRKDPSLVDMEIAAYGQEYEERTKLGLKPRLTPEQFRLTAYSDEVFNLARDGDADLIALNALEDRILNGEDKYSQLPFAERTALASVLGGEIADKTAYLSASINDRKSNLLSNVAFGNDYRKEASQLVADARALNDFALVYELETDFVAHSIASESFGTDGFSSQAELLDARAELVKQFGEAETEEAQIVARKALTQLDAMSMARQKAVNEDPASYVIQSYEARGRAAPTTAQMLNAQARMGVEPANRKVVTNSKAEAIMSAVTSAETPDEMAKAIAGSGIEDDYGADLMRQLRGSGLSLAHNYILSNPKSPTSATLLKAIRSEAVTGELAPTKTQMKFINAAVLQNPTFQSHAKSMGGGLYLSTLGDKIVSSSVDTPSMQRAREAHQKMIADLTTFLAVEDGQVFGSDGISEPSQLTEYVDKAVSILDEKYSYVNVNNSVTRLPKSIEAFAPDVSTGVKLILNTTPAEEIVYKDDIYPEGTPEYNARKETYISEVLENYQFITQNGDSSGIVTDKYGGAVMIKMETDSGMVETPLTINFIDAVDANSTRGRNSLDKLTKERQALQREANNIFGDELKTPEGKARKQALEAQAAAIDAQINERKRSLAKIGL